MLQLAYIYLFDNYFYGQKVHYYPKNTLRLQNTYLERISSMQFFEQTV